MCSCACVVLLQHEQVMAKWLHFHCQLALRLGCKSVDIHKTMAKWLSSFKLQVCGHIQDHYIGHISILHVCAVQSVTDL